MKRPKPQPAAAEQKPSSVLKVQRVDDLEPLSATEWLATILRQPFPHPDLAMAVLLVKLDRRDNHEPAVVVQVAEVGGTAPLPEFYVIKARDLLEFIAIGRAGMPKAEPKPRSRIILP